MAKPPESIGMLNGLHYKEGKFGFAFWWDGAYWVKSNMKMEEVRSLIRSGKSHTPACGRTRK